MSATTPVLVSQHLTVFPILMTPFAVVNNQLTEKIGVLKMSACPLPKKSYVIDGLLTFFRKGVGMQ